MANLISWGAKVSTPNGLADRTGLFGFGKKPASGGVSGTGTPAAWSAAQAAYQPPAAAIPLDPIYAAQVGGLQSKRDSMLAQFAAAKPRTLADFGYTASGYDSTGAPMGLQFDVNNPFSRAALLQRSAQQQKAGTATSAAARGQGISGALNSEQQANEFNYQQGNDALIKALVSSLVNIASQESAATTDYEIGAGQALGDSIGRAQSAPPPPPAPTPGPVAALGIPDGDYNRNNIPPALLAQGVKLAPGYHVQVRGGRVVNILKY